MKHAERVEILVGDVRARLGGMESDSVDCVVTSPPYWGLRDYGTAAWDGGDPSCDHVKVDAERTPWANSVKGPGNPGKNGTKYANMTKEVGGRCEKCGAVRVDNQIGLERTLGDHLAVMVEVFREVRRVLKPTGVCWINYGDCYATAPNGRSAADTKALTDDDRIFRDKPFSTVGAIYDSKHRASTSKQRNRHHGTAAQGGRVVSAGYLKPKDLCMVSQRLFIALQDDGWWVRSVLPWVKRNGMPESITDRPANSLEYVAMLTKSERYWYDAEAVRKTASPGTNARVARNATAAGSVRANGGSRPDRPMKAVGRAPGVTPKSAPHISGSGPGRNRANDSWHEATSGEILTDRNFRNTDLFYSSIAEPWGLVSDADGLPLAIDANPAGFSEAHFATFPPALVEPLILAGCPEHVCGKCGLAWDKSFDHVPGWDGSRYGERAVAASGGAINGGTAKSTLGSANGKSTGKRVVSGYGPACDCGADPVGGRVLDPFGGAGTTGLVAASLGRLATLIELNPEYATLARVRIEAAFMGREEGQRHMVKQLGKLDVGAGPLFDAIG